MTVEDGQAASDQPHTSRHKPRRLRHSVGRSLALLVGCHTLVITLIILVALRALNSIATDGRQMYDLQLRSIADIGEAMQDAAELSDKSQFTHLETFLKRYKKEWEIASPATPQAHRFRQELLRRGESDILDREDAALADLSNSLKERNVDDAQDSLAALHSINAEYAQLDNQYSVQRADNARAWLLVIGIGGALLTLALGLAVFYTVVPRAKRLVEKVETFRETGTHVRIGDMGNDAIGLLANALDTGFSAIVEREREREQFLAIAAHELKTPLTSIQGYSSLVLSHPDVPLLFRALEVINRQSWRLSRLIDGLFLAIRARSKDLRYLPKHFDMSALVERVLNEMKPFVEENTFSARIEENISVIGDEALLEQALWSLFTSASALSPKASPVRVSLQPEDWRAIVTVRIEGESISTTQLEELFQPFRSIEYETGAKLRLTTGLYLCREIIRVHNGRLWVRQLSEDQSEFVMELPM